MKESVTNYQEFKVQTSRKKVVNTQYNTVHTPPFKDYLDSNQGEKNLVWPIFLFDLSCAKSIILANSVGNPQRNSHFKCLFYEKNIKISIRYEAFGSFHSKYK